MSNKGKKPFYLNAWFLVVIAVVVVGVVIGVSKMKGPDNAGTNTAQTANEENNNASNDASNQEATATDEASSNKDKFGMDKKDVKEVKKTVPGKHIYNKSVIKPVYGASNKEAMGRYSVIKAKSKDCTTAALTDWYNNYVLKDNYNYCIILYTDKPGKGCYAVQGLVFKNTKLVTEKGQGKEKIYYLGDSSKAITYIAQDGKLVKNK